MGRMFAIAATVALLATPVAAQQIEVTGPRGQTKSFGAAELAALPQATVTLRHGGHGDGKDAAYEGATLASVLRAVGSPAGPRMHGAPTRLLVLVTGGDGYKAVFTLVETDPWFGKGAIIIADKKAGGPLDEKEGPWRLVVADDAHPERAVRGVAKIEVVPAP